MSPRQLCNVVYAILIEPLDEEKRDEFLYDLDAPIDPMEQADRVWAEMGLNG